jgi:hypothetical protein
MLIIGVILEDPIIPLRSSKEIKEIGIGMIKKSKPLSKITLLLRKKERRKDVDPEIHCLGDTSSSPHLTQSAYEESLMDSQLNELSKGERTSGNPNRYNLRSKKKEGKPDISDQPTRAENPAKSVAASSK